MLYLLLGQLAKATMVIVLDVGVNKNVGLSLPPGKGHGALLDALKHGALAAQPSFCLPLQWVGFCV